LTEIVSTVFCLRAGKGEHTHVSLVLGKNVGEGKAQKGAPKEKEGGGKGKGEGAGNYLLYACFHVSVDITHGGERHNTTETDKI